MAILSLKTEPDPNHPDLPGFKLSQSCLTWINCVAGSQAETVEDVLKLRDERVFAALQVFIL